MPFDASNNTPSDVITLPELNQRLAWGISEGVPIDPERSNAQRVSEIRGAWVTVSVTAANGSATFTHNLGIPVTSVTGGGGTANLPNVRWRLMGAEYGDRTGATAAPAAPGAFTIDFVKMVNATVTPDAIDLQYSVTGFVPDATHPLSITMFFVAAII